MFKPARPRVLHVWIALLAILFSVLAPAFSQAGALPMRTAAPMEICTMDGIRTMTPDSQDQDAPPAGHLLKHCSYCFSHSPPATLPPPTALLITSAGGTAPYPPLFYQAAHALFPWTAANPRAPPASV